MIHRQLPELEPCEIDYVKAVCGGGKTVAMLRKIAANRQERYLYAVPTIDLAYDIKSTWLSSAVKGKACDIHIITSREPGRIIDMVDMVTNPWERRLIVMTHQALLTGDYRYNFSGWNIIFDEDPQLIDTATLSDAQGNFGRFQQIVTKGAVTRKFQSKELTEQDEKELATIARSNEYRNDLPQNMRDMCKKLSGAYYYLILARTYNKGVMYYLAAFSHFRLIVEHASRVTILGSRLSGYTRAYLKLMNIHLRVSEIQAEHDSYPIAVQRKVSVKRVFESGNNSIARVERYSLTEIIERIYDDLNQPFLIRTNKKFKEVARAELGVVSWLPRKANGLNIYRELNAVADLAAFNFCSVYHQAFKALDKLLNLPIGSWKKYTAENAFEDSCQAIFRIAIRNINESDPSDYTVVVPDMRTESYLREHYLPHARYLGYIVDDGKSERPVGRPVNPSTLKKVTAVEDLMENFQYSQAEACREVKLDPKTYRRYRLNIAA